tara:strand:- start:2932 stop:6669 length:3738 start_codon:yes stop_codon:yes gene_type:complete
LLPPTEFNNIDELKSLETIAIALNIALGAQLNAADSLVARWDFDGKDRIKLTKHGAVTETSGPLAPEFPLFSTNNRAVRLAGKGTRLMYPDKEGQFKFRNGDAITIEAWVRLDGRKVGAPMYVIGKGRTHDARFFRNNQNWSLRIIHDGRVARANFLFASFADGSFKWHRWASQVGFDDKSGWHHVALAYRFGDPKTIRAWIDGVPSGGKWDIDGETKHPPVVDDDALWIGSALAGNAGNTFRGWLDGIAVHRVLLDDKAIAQRFKRVGGPQIVKNQAEPTAKPKPKTKPLPEVMPEVDAPSGKVLLTIAEGFPTELRWRHEGEPEPKEFVRWSGDAFVLPRIPIRHDAWGIRAAWNVPLLLRMVADVEIPQGEQRFMMRTRALSRLWIDGELVARGEPITKQPPNGEEPVTPVRKPPLPGLRIAGYHQQEVFGTANITNKTSRIVFETVVGGTRLRPETGEILLALQTPDGKSYSIVRPDGNHLPLIDQNVEPVLESIGEKLDEMNDMDRRTLAAKHDQFWSMRHDFAKKWAQANPAPPVPEMPGVENPIDAFIQAKIARAKARAHAKPFVGTFHKSILPLLRDRCFRCHGEKEKGGLKLDERERLLEAVVPGDPHGSELIKRIRTRDEDDRMPPTGDPLDQEQITQLEKWITNGAPWPAAPVDPKSIRLSARLEDSAFIRRAYLDSVGVPPTYDEAIEFLADRDPKKRQRLIRKLTTDKRGADHWTSYWQDMLAENPALLNQAQGSTGPFRWFIHDSLRDGKALDRMVTELIMLRGGKYEGGAAGFGMAAENDSPFAAKGHIVASAFLGIELQCARCHDAPYHDSTQRDLYSLAAMFQRKPASAPKTSQVPAEFFEKRERRALIQVTLKPGEHVPPKWRFSKITGIEDGKWLDGRMENSKDSRERLATLVTSPENRRFPQIVVNRIWKRLMGAGLVEPVHDWETGKASHPRLLDWLAHRFVRNGYDAVSIIRLIMNSDAYQRDAIEGNLAAVPDSRYFNGPERRRLTAEQIVDSLYVVTGNEMDIGELTFVHDGKRALSNRQTLGFPKRAWMLANLNNERDRPSLSLPKARAIVDVLEAFGWKGTRQQPIYHRESEANVLQPGVLANGILVSSLSRASVYSDLAESALEAESVEELVNEMFLRVLSREPMASEQKQFVAVLKAGFAQRKTAKEMIKPVIEPDPLPQVTWFNHGRHKANSIQQELERRVRKGPAPDPRLRPEWRKRFEDMVWSLINHREFVWVP